MYTYYIQYPKHRRAVIISYICTTVGSFTFFLKECGLFLMQIDTRYNNRIKDFSLELVLN